MPKSSPENTTTKPSVLSLDADHPSEWIQEEITWMVGGLAGYGINSSGEMFSRCFTRGGLNVFAYLEYPSLIRGGHNNYNIRVSKRKITSQVNKIDLLVCLNRETFDLHQMKVPAGGGIIYDHEDFQIKEEELTNEGVHLYPVPLLKIVKDNEGIDVMRNTVALGASLALLKYPFDYLQELIARQFEKKGEKVINLNVKVARAGYDHIAEHYDTSKFIYHITPNGGKPGILLTGNAALTYGAIQAGCKFFAAYPMTPTSSVLNIMAQHEEEMSIVVKQPEDEIAGVLYTLGANYAGVRGMIATSGGGFALMNEAMSMAGISEIPLVIIMGSRPGPGTGLPTWTSQGDLLYMIHAGHDEFPRVVIAPGDHEEAFFHITQAFNIAERYHMPVLVNTDKYLSEGLVSVTDFDMSKITRDRGPLATPEEVKYRVDNKVVEDYPRYKFTDSGVSPRPLPGMENTRYVCNSNEHDQLGDIDEEAENRTQMHSKRLRKLESVKKELPAPIVYGPTDADVSLITWGTTKGPALEAMSWLEHKGIKVNMMHVIYIHPFPAEAMTAFMKKAKKTLLLELNHDSQFGQLIRQNTLMEVTEKFLKWDGRPFFPQEICDKVKSLL